MRERKPTAKTLSLTVPVYNTAAYLPRCLDSVLAEEVLDELELIVVNDGSTDRSAAIIRDYAARYPDTLRFIDKPNGGHGSAVNAGLQAASGRYFRVLDSDDWFDTPAFLRFMRQLRGCEEDLVVTPYTQEYAWDGVEIDHDYPYLRHGQRFSLDEIDWREGMDYFSLASSAWRTELLRSCGLRLYENCSYVDMQYNLFPIPFVKTLRFLDIPVYRYFLGRAEQSMAPGRMRRQLPMHERVLRSLISCYGSRADALSPGARRYMLLMIACMYRTHCQLLSGQSRSRTLAYRSLRELEAWVRCAAPEVYRSTAAIPYLCFSRRLGYLNVLLLSRRALSLLALLRQKLRRVRGEAAV